jgi:short-subunit dehydrogenase
LSARKIVLVTGASIGIGAELARVFASHGHDLALAARSRDKLEALADEIEAAGAGSGRPRPIVIEIDVARPDSADALIARLLAEDASVEILVNNAGFGLIGPASALARAEQIEMIDLNVRALTDLTLAFLPELRAARGRILNVASVAAFLPGPGMAVYYATKAFVLSFSEALWFELKDEGVAVSALCPGPTASGFGARAGVHPEMLDSVRGLTAREVAQAGYDGLMAGRRVVVPGFGFRLSAWFARFAPRLLAMSFVARVQMKRVRLP